MEDEISRSPPVYVEEGRNMARKATTRGRSAEYLAENRRRLRAEGFSPKEADRMRSWSLEKIEDAIKLRQENPASFSLPEIDEKKAKARKGQGRDRDTAPKLKKPKPEKKESWRDLVPAPKDENLEDYTELKPSTMKYQAGGGNYIHDFRRRYAYVWWFVVMNNGHPTPKWVTRFAGTPPLSRTRTGIYKELRQDLLDFLAEQERDHETYQENRVIKSSIKLISMHFNPKQKMEVAHKAVIPIEEIKAYTEQEEYIFKKLKMKDW